MWDARQYPFDIGPIFGIWEFPATRRVRLLTELGDLRAIIWVNFLEFTTDSVHE